MDEVTKVRIRGAMYRVGDVVALIGYNERKGYTAVMRIDKFSKTGNHIGEYLNGEKIYTANAYFIRSRATAGEIADEMERRKSENLRGSL